MDIYTNPAKNTYVLGITKLFVMPTDSGGIPAVAVSKRASVYISSAYTILIIPIFTIGWNLILAIMMKIRGSKDDHSKTPLVALWESGESMNAMMLISSYWKKVVLKSTGGGDLKWEPGDLTWGLPFLLMALAIAGGNGAAGVLVPGQLEMGNVAPADRDIIFYPDVARYTRNDDNGTGIAKLDSLKAPSVLRALGAIEASEVTVRDRVHLDSGIAGSSAYLSYDYTVTGVDMGLQSDPKLKLMVKGSCRTDDTWLLSSTDQEDTYRLFGGNDTFVVKYQVGVALPPMGTFFLSSGAGGGSNVSYAMIVNTAGRYSYTSGQDPWYVTDKNGANVSVAYRVREGRPALSCWEAKTWHLNGAGVDGSKLNTLPGLKLGKLWANTVFPIEFRDPRVVSMGNAAGPAALKSASYAAVPPFILDAGASAILNDLERLVLASWVSSRNILSDTTTYESGEMVNIARGPGGLVEDSSAKFVLQSGDVATLSASTLIAVPVVLLFLLILEMTLVCALKRSHLWKKPVLDGEKNIVALKATHLFRELDKRIHPLNKWEQKGSSFPFVYPSGSAGPATGTGTSTKHTGAVAQEPVNDEGQ